MAQKSPLELMQATSQKYQKASDLMQDAANQEMDEVEVQDGRGPRAPTSFSKPQAQSVKQYNNHNQSTINQHFVQSQDAQTERMDKQIHLAQQQAHTMKQLHGTMEQMLDLMVAQSKKIDPKYQEFSKADGPAEVNGQAKNGMMDKLGEMLGDALGGIGGLGDMFRRDRGGRNNRRDRNNRNNRNNRSGNRGGSWVDRLKDRMSNRSGSPSSSPSSRPGRTPRVGGGWRGRLATAAMDMGSRFLGTTTGKVVAGAAAGYGTYKAYEGLGSISAGNESARGVHEISTGIGDAGGVSYGAHQLSSKTGTMAKFLSSPEGQPFAAEFQGMSPGSAAFNKKYEQVANERGAEFAKAQKGFIDRTHYAPMVNNVLKGTGMDFSKKGKAVQEMLYSTGVQYGSGTSVINNALKGKNVANMSDADIITTVQDYKSATVGQYFRSSAPNIQQSVANRAQKEKAQLLAFNQQELQAKAAGEDSVATATAASAEGESMASLAAPGMSTVSSTSPMMPASNDSGTGDAVAAGAAVAGTGALLMANRGTPTTPSLAPTTPSPVVTPTTPALPTPTSSATTGVEKGAVKTAEKTAVNAGVKGAVKTGAKTVGRALPGANVMLGAYDAYEIINDEEATQAEKERALSETGGGMAGASAGASAGAAAGAAVGSFFFGVGAVPGAFIGGLIGGGLGYWGGSEAGGAVYDAAMGTPEEQAAAEAAKSAAPVAGAVPLMMKMPETPAKDQTATDAAKAMANVDAAIQQAVAPLKGEPAAAVAEAKKATADSIASATASIPTAGALASAVPQTPGDMSSMLSSAMPTGAGLAGGLMTGLLGMGMPEGWASTIMSGYSEAQAIQAAAMSGAPVSNIPLPTTSQSPVVTAAPPGRTLPAVQNAAPVVAPSAETISTPTSSPANPAYYKDSDVSPQASAVQATTTASTVSSTQSQGQAPSVKSTGGYAEPVQRQQYEPVKSVMMIEPKRQDTMMPERFKGPQQRISSKGVSEGNSIRQTIAEAPAVIMDNGLVLLQTGFI